MAETDRGAPSLSASIDGYDNTTRLLIALAARAASIARLPADTRIDVDGLNITESLKDFKISPDVQATPAQNEAAEKDAGPTEVDEKEVAEQEKKIAAATAADTPKLSEEEQQREREKQKKLLQGVEAANAGASADRRRKAKEWADDVARHCKLDPESLPPKPRAADLKPSIQNLSREVHLDIIHDLLMLSLHLPPPPKSDTTDAKDVKQNQAKPPENAGVYTPLARYLLFATAEILNIPEAVVYDSEKAQAQKLYFLMNETKKAEEEKGGAAGSSSEAERMKQTSQGAIVADQKKRSSWTWAATGAGFLVGGVAIGLTGGLAAPLVAPLLVTATGGALSFLATSGGAVLLGTMFGLYGGGLTAFRAQRRMQGIEEFEFIKIEDKDMPGIPSLTATIISSGFLIKPDDYIAPYQETYLEKLKDRRDAYALKAESQAFLSAGKALDSYVKNFLVGKAISEVIKRTALAAVYAAVALPATVYKTATKALDNEFQQTTDKAQKAGILLADVLEKGVQGNRPTILIGSSLGAVTIMTCLLELHKRNLSGLVFDAILISLPAAPTPTEWLKMRQVTSRRLVNAYSTNDWVLAIIARLHTLISTRLSFGVAGLQAVEIGAPGEVVENVDLSDILKGHLEIGPKMTQVLERVNLEK